MNNFADILKEIGEFDLFQKCLLLALCIPSIFAAFSVIGQVFISLSFRHQCNTDWILALSHNLTYQKQRNLTIPMDKDGKFESCEMFTPVDLDLETIEAYGINGTTGCINGWDYERTIGVSSTVTEFDLVCDKRSLHKISQAIYMGGFLIGALVFGSVADRFGRRFAVLLAILLLVLFSVGNAFSPNIYIFMVLNFFCGFSCSGILPSTTVIGVEWTNQAKSAIFTTVILIFTSVGLMLLSGIAYLIQDWRILQIVLFSPLLLLLGIYYCFLPESVRWLMTHGKKEEVQREVRRAARMNGRTVPEDLLDKLEMEGTSRKGNMLDILRRSDLRKRTLIMGFNWFAIGLLYYGLSLNVESFGQNIYLTQFLFSIVEVPADLVSLFVIQHFGRRRGQAWFLLCGGAACLAIIAIPDDLPVVTTVIAVLGKFAAGGAFSIAYIYTPELYPTVVRQNGLGLNSMCCRVAGILSPLLRILEVYHDAIPLLICGIVPIAAGGLGFLLPETHNVELLDHLELQKMDSLIQKTNRKTTIRQEDNKDLKCECE
ncbi:solute carrier family 22 member 13-like [Genypterus blacodes]|uniref:solute carrier family 22 member 13-like n=1 Tax=Genypterus blacodes TaxID=154954 RepID=UPI003F75A1B4